MTALPLTAAPKRRAVDHPVGWTREAIVATATRAADGVVLSFHPRLHRENAVYFDGLVLFGEQLNAQAPGSGNRFLESAAAVLLSSDDPIETVGHRRLRNLLLAGRFLHGGSWLALAGSTLDDPARRELTKDLAYEWIESYVLRPSATLGRCT